MALTYKILLSVGVILLFLWLYTALATSRFNQRYPPLGATVEIDGNKVHYTDSGGEGRPIVLLHGASSNLRDFHSSILGPLSSDFRVVVIDRPGFGNSTRRSGGWLDPARQASVLRTMFEKIDVERPVLLGHSWSGALVMAYLVDYPGEASGGVLVAPAIYPWPTPSSIYNRIAGIPVLGQVVAHTLVMPLGQLVLGPGIRYVLSPGEIPPGYRNESAIDGMLRPDTFLFNAEDLRNLSGFLETLSTRYGEVSTPLLAITGEGDNVVSNDHHVGQLLKAVPHAKVIEIPKGGHAPHQTNRDRVVEIVRDFANAL